jgi:hypothetical protein
MNGDDEAEVIFRYRSAARELPTPAMDAGILRAASRAAHTKRSRHLGILAVAATIVALIVGYRMLTPIYGRPAPGVAEVASSYGKFEGRSRSFLMRESESAGIGPGSTNFIRIQDDVGDETHE